MDELENAASIDFIPRTNEGDYLHIRDSGTNSSWVGRIGGSQFVEIYNWNVRFIMVHEFMHAMGIFHEQQRPDRDQFVTIRSENIQPGVGVNFSIQVGAATHGAYDYDSVMHYDRCAFSTCCPTGSSCGCAAACETITAPQPIGQRGHLSAGDFAVLQFLYPGCDIWTRACETCTPGPRRHHTMAYDAARSQVLLYGGMTTPQTTSTLGDTWTWDGGGWTLRSTDGPGPRYQAKMVYEASQSRVLLFGGYLWVGGSTFQTRGDTWGWNGTSWSQLANSGPPVRGEHAMAYDPQRGAVVLFGGMTAGGGYVGDTWEWSAGAWAQRSTTGPAGRRRHAMAYDSTRGRVVMFGGETASGDARDTWEWNGSAWQQMDTSGPSASFACSMSMSASGRPVLFGGSGPAGLSQTVWEWTGSAWAELTSSGPSARFNQAMAYDSQERRITLYGGSNQLILGDTWELGCGGSANPAPCYANCDASSTTPVLNVGDFTCFLQQFAGGQLYANCDQSITPPILNVGDFTCFLQRFATGCP
jgi:hypothetical protein